MYDHVLLATDGSPNAERAIDHALAIAERFDSTLHVFSVIQNSEHRDQIRADTGREIEDVVERIVARGEDRGITVVSEIGEGVPQEAILEYVDDNRVDLIAMGTHGQSGLGRILTGSVAEKVLRNSGVPVLAVKPEDES